MARETSGDSPGASVSSAAPQRGATKRRCSTSQSRESSQRCRLVLGRKRHLSINLCQILLCTNNSAALSEISGAHINHIQPSLSNLCSSVIEIQTIRYRLLPNPEDHIGSGADPGNGESQVSWINCRSISVLTHKYKEVFAVASHVLYSHSPVSALSHCLRHGGRISRPHFYSLTEQFTNSQGCSYFLKVKQIDGASGTDFSPKKVQQQIA